MDSASPIAARIAGQPSDASGTFFKPTFTMGFLTLVENLFVGRRWLGGRPETDTGIGNTDTERGYTDTATGHCHRRYRDHHYRSADGDGHAS